MLISKTLLCLFIIVNTPKCSREYDVLQKDLNKTAALMQIEVEWSSYEYSNTTKELCETYNILYNEYKRVPRVEGLPYISHEYAQHQYQLASKFENEDASKYNAGWVAEIRREIWMWVEQMTNPQVDPVWRRHAALRIIAQIGERDFYSCNIPNPVPMRFLPWTR